MMLYTVYVRPILDYGSIIFNSNSKQNCLLIEKVQKRFTRYVFNRCYKYVYPIMPIYSERLQILKLETLQSHRLKIDLIYFHKLITNNVQIETCFPLFCDAYITRTNIRGLIPISSTKNSRNEFFLTRIPKYYLKLPPEIVSLPLPSFIQAIKAFDISKIL